MARGYVALQYVKEGRKACPASNEQSALQWRRQKVQKEADLGPIDIKFFHSTKMKERGKGRLRWCP